MDTDGVMELVALRVKVPRAFVDYVKRTAVRSGRDPASHAVFSSCLSDLIKAAWASDKIEKRAFREYMESLTEPTENRQLHQQLATGRITDKLAAIELRAARRREWEAAQALREARRKESERKMASKERARQEGLALKAQLDETDLTTGLPGIRELQDGSWCGFTTLDGRERVVGTWATRELARAGYSAALMATLESYNREHALASEAAAKTREEKDAAERAEAEAMWDWSKNRLESQDVQQEIPAQSAAAPVPEPVPEAVPESVVAPLEPVLRRPHDWGLQAITWWMENTANHGRSVYAKALHAELLALAAERGGQTWHSHRAMAAWMSANPDLLAQRWSVDVRKSPDGFKIYAFFPLEN